MAMRVAAIYSAPVKSLALSALESADLGSNGIPGDRAFFLVNERERLVTQREAPALAQVKVAYDPASDVLALAFPDGRTVSGAPKDAEAMSARFFGMRDVAGAVVDGPWAEALSEHCGVALRLVRSAGNSFDALPVSMLSSASVDALRASSGEPAIDERRFRPNIYIAGVDEAHGEDAWIGREVRVGEAVVRVLLRDPRCEMTTHDPDTGARDFNTLRLIAAYRTDQPKDVNFGVYGVVVTPGRIAVNDDVVPV